MTDGPITDDGVRVCDDLCPTCIFRPGNRMHLRPGRVRQMVDDAQRNDAAIICHETLDGPGAICRGWYNRFADRTIIGRLALMRPLEVKP